MIYLNIHQADEGVIIAMCDESLIGRTLEEGNVFIDLNAYASFYKGELVKAEKAKKTVAEYREKMSSANIIGEESIGVALAADIIAKSNIAKVQKIPYAHAYAVRTSH